MNDTHNIKAEEFCSQKLWQIVTEEEPAKPEDLQAAISELAKRRHYLTELEQLGKLRPQS